MPNKISAKVDAEMRAFFANKGAPTEPKQIGPLEVARALADPEFSARVAAANAMSPDEMPNPTAAQIQQKGGGIGGFIAARRALIRGEKL